MLKNNKQQLYIDIRGLMFSIDDCWLLEEVKRARKSLNIINAKAADITTV